MKKRKPFWRQGDVGILKIDKLPDGGAVEIEHDGILAYGEVTGHKHQLVGDGIKYFRDSSGTLFFEITSRFVDLNHGSMPTARVQPDDHHHYSHRLPAGIYQKTVPQREADWFNEVNRNVED